MGSVMARFVAAVMVLAACSSGSESPGAATPPEGFESWAQLRADQDLMYELRQFHQRVREDIFAVYGSELAAAARDRDQARFAATWAPFLAAWSDLERLLDRFVYVDGNTHATAVAALDAWCRAARTCPAVGHHVPHTTRIVLPLPLPSRLHACGAADAGSTGD